VNTKKTILIVDDSEFVRNYHSYILEEADFQVVTAVDGSDGLEKLYTHSCDLVLSDINMSNMDGYESYAGFAPTRSTARFPSSSYPRRAKRGKK